MIVVIIAIAVILFANIIGSLIYDLSFIRQKRLFNKTPRARKYRPRPLVTIVIGGVKKEDALKQCLDSIAKGSYRKVEVIILSPSTKSLRKITNNYKKIPITLSEMSAKASYEKFSNGELVVTVDANVIFDKKCLSTAVWLFNASPKVQSVILNQAAPSSYRLRDVFRGFNLVVARLFAKSASTYGLKRAFHYTLTRRDQYIDSSTAPAYFSQESILETADAHIPNSPTAAARLAKTLCLLFATALLGYWAYIAVALYQPTLLILAISTFSLFLLFALWNDLSLRLSDKINYSLLLPVTYLSFYIFAFVRILTFSRIKKIPAR